MNRCGVWTRVTLYVLSGIACAFAIWSFIYSWGYIGGGIAIGQLRFAGYEYEIVHFFMGNSIQYLFFSAILFTLGRFVGKEERKSSPENEEDNDEASGADEAQADSAEPEDRDAEDVVEKDAEKVDADDEQNLR